MTQKILKELFDYSPLGLFIEKTFRGGRSAKKGSAQTGTGLNVMLKRKRYSKMKICGKNYLLHRLIFLWHHGSLPSQIDHINGDIADNRIENLRAATSQQNQANIGPRKHNKLGLKGVTYRSDVGKFYAHIRRNGKTIHIGAYKTKEEAACAYDKKAFELFGDFANLNFCSGDILSYSP